MHHDNLMIESSRHWCRLKRAGNGESPVLIADVEWIHEESGEEMDVAETVGSPLQEQGIDKGSPFSVPHRVLFDRIWVVPRDKLVPWGASFLFSQ